jgi:hypothetical protein
MGLASLVFALFTTGYILGAWAACLVLKQSQDAYEDGLPTSFPTTPMELTRAPLAGRRK